MNSFSDVFKKSFLSANFADLSLTTIILALVAAFLCGMLIYFVYKKFYKGVIYNNNFNITSNVVLSLGMVGALSIVRFRTAVKDPLDVGFLFWAVAVGITCGAGLYVMSFVCTVFISIIYILLVNLKATTRVYLLIVKFDNEANEEVQKVLKGMKHVLKNKTVINEKTELTVEIKVKDENTSFVTLLSNLQGVYSATLVEYTGDFGE